MMDVKDLLESLDYSKENIHRQALVYSFSNIFTLSLLSNFGIKYDLPDEDIKNFIEKLNMDTSENIMDSKESEANLTIDEEESQDNLNKQVSFNSNFSFIKELCPIKAVYSKSSLNASIDDALKNNTDIDFDINDENFEKILHPKNQGLLILNEVKLSKFLYDKSVIDKNKDSTSTEKLIGMVLLDSAVNQGLFCHGNLRNSNGFFIRKESSILDSNELRLNEINEEIDWEDQVYMLWAYGVLYDTLSNPKFERYFDAKKADIFKQYALNILNILKSNEHEIIELDTSSLSNLTSSIIEALNILDKEKKHKTFVLSLCDELYARQKQKGFVLSNKYEKEAASLASHFKSIEALVNGFQYTNYDLFLNTSEQIYTNLNSIWDEKLGLFKLNKDDDIKYSSKSISFVLRSLNKLLNVTNSSSLKQSISNQITNFFDSSINDTGLQSAPPNIINEINMFRNSDSDASLIQNIVDNKKAYIIKKGFKIDKTDYKINKYSDEFSCEHALFASDAMLSIAIDSSFR